MGTEEEAEAGDLVLPVQNRPRTPGEPQLVRRLHSPARPDTIRQVNRGAGSRNVPQDD